MWYGWIDGRKKTDDEVSWLQKFTARREKSIWSRINREKAQALIQSRPMKAAGPEAIERAKGNGRCGAAYAILFRVQTAKKAETRTRRIQQFISMLGKHEMPYP
jgi:uncharacterized protein YdeI (YjbR/CyaY-like superfamily)